MRHRSTFRSVYSLQKYAAPLLSVQADIEIEDKMFKISKASCS